jgi:hypothetical protein
MKNFIDNYKQILTPEVRVSRTEISPRNIYRISVYKDGDPVFKSRYVFVIGEVGDKIHCLLLNKISPNNFINFLNRLRNKTIAIKQDQRLKDLLKILPKDGRQLFESYVKPNSGLYTPAMDNYRTYIKSKIQHVWEIRFEDGFLKEVFKEGNTISTRRETIQKEINENDG